jgi:thioredoxin-like negative regulator of GroEL
MSKLELLTEFDFYRRLATSPGASLVLFSAPACGACRQAEAMLPQALAGAVARLYKVDAQQSQALAREYEVFHLPALFLFVDGHYHAPVHGPLSPAKLRQAVLDALRSPPEEAP